MPLRRVKKTFQKINPRENSISIEQFFNNQGLEHIGENILTNLDHASVISCRKVCKNWKNLIDNAHSMLKACAKKASKNQNSQFYHQWIKLIVECQDMKYYYQDIISLLKAMQQDMTMQEKKFIFKSPIHVALNV